MMRWVGLTLCALILGACGEAKEEDLVRDACRKATNIPCAESSEAECNLDLKEERADAQRVGCGSEFDAYLRCVIDAPLSCSADNDLIVPASCKQARERYTSCETRLVPICSATPAQPSPTSPCQTTCSDGASASCTGDGGLECSCTEGSKKGATFAIEACADLIEAISAHCR